MGSPALESQKQNIHTDIMRHSKILKCCVGVVDIQESVFPKFQVFSYRFTVVMDKAVLGGREPDYVRYTPTTNLTGPIKKVIIYLLIYLRLKAAQRCRTLNPTKV